MIEQHFCSVEERDESRPMEIGARHRVGVVLVIDTLPSVSELGRRGKNVARVKERWLSLKYDWLPTDVFQVSRYPGTRRHGILALFKPPLRRFSSWGDLRRASIGKWTDTQMVDGDSLVGFSVREEECVFRIKAGAAAPRWTDGFGEMLPVSDEWIRFLLE